MTFYGKNKEKKKKVAVILAALAVFTIMASTFAWSSYTAWKKNHMQSKGYVSGEVSIVEQFPDPEIKPGGEIKKEVSIVNASENNVFVRVSFEEMLQKLADGAAPNGYATQVASGFPAVIDSSEYTKAGSLWQDQTSDLRIDGAVPVAPTNGDIGYKLYVNNNQTLVTYIKKTTRAYYPTNFEFDRPGSVVPVFSGSFAADDAQVAQKVTGSSTKLPNNAYNFVTQANSGDLTFYGYGKEIGTKIEKNWAGKAIKLSDTTLPASKPADPTASAADDTIKFVMANVGTDPAAIGAKDWFYNKDDGYFYYTRKLMASSSTNNTVIQAIKIPDDNTYAIASYDLWIGMEAIPSYLAAMLAEVDSTQDGQGSGGWGLTTTDKMYQYFTAIADAE